MIKVTLRFDETSEPIVMYAHNVYTKGPLYCLRVEAGGGKTKTVKFPLCKIFSTTEEGGYTTQE